MVNPGDFRTAVSGLAGVLNEAENSPKREGVTSVLDMLPIIHSPKGGPHKAMNSSTPTNVTNEARVKLISSYVLVGEYGLLFLAAVVILMIVCWRSTSRLRTRLVYFYVITIVISLGTLSRHDSCPAGASGSLIYAVPSTCAPPLVNIATDASP